MKENMINTEIAGHLINRYDELVREKANVDDELLRLKQLMEKREQFITGKASKIALDCFDINKNTDEVFCVNAKFVNSKMQVSVQCEAFEFTYYDGEIVVTNLNVKSNNFIKYSDLNNFKTKIEKVLFDDQLIKDRTPELKEKYSKELIELIWKIKPESTTENNNGLIWTSEVEKTIKDYFWQGEENV